MDFLKQDSHLSTYKTSNGQSIEDRDVEQQSLLDIKDRRLEGELDQHANQDHPAEKKKDLSLLQVLLVVNVFQICYAIMLSLIKDMTTKRDVGVFEIAFFRSFVQMIANFQVIRQIKLEYFQYFDIVPKALYPVLFWHSIVGSTAIIPYTTAPMYIPLGVVQVIYSLTVFTVAIMAWIYLGEAISVVEVFAMFFSFYGIFLTQQLPNEEQGDLSLTDNDSLFGILLAFLAVFGMTWLSTANRKLKEVNPAFIQFNLAVVSVLICGVCLAVTATASKTYPFVYQSWWTYGQLGGVGLTNFLAQYLFTVAEQGYNPATVLLLAQIGVIYMFASDYVFFDERFTPIQQAGAAICLICFSSVACYKLLREQKPSSME